MEPLASPNLVLFLGRFHPTVLHLPIGFFLALLVFELRAARRGRSGGDATRLLLGLTSGSAVLAAALGWLLSRDATYDGALLSWHQWLALAFTGLSLLALVLERLAATTAYRLSLAAGLVALVLAGHFGGSLTHGAGYLTRYAPFGWRPRPARPVDGGADQQARVVLQTHCVECHGPEKQESGLRLDQRGPMLQGGDSGRPAAVPGDAMGSELVRRVTLSRDAEDAMPPDGRKGLSAEDSLRLINWIQQGAAWAGPLDSLEGTLDATGDAELAALRSNGVEVDVLSEGRRLLKARLVRTRGGAGGQALRALSAVAPRVTWLDVGGAELAPDEWGLLSSFENLARLHLEGSNVTDEHLASLAGMAYLEYLNLHSTAVTDAGLEHLVGLPSLQQLYLWESGVSASGARRLREALPDATIDTGSARLPQISSNGSS